MMDDEDKSLSSVEVAVDIRRQLKALQQAGGSQALRAIGASLVITGAPSYLAGPTLFDYRVTAFFSPGPFTSASTFLRKVGSSASGNSARGFSRRCR